MSVLNNTGTYHHYTFRPNLTAGQYAAGSCIGGLLTFTNAMSPTGSCILDTVKARFSTTQTTNLEVHIFKRQPIGTYTDFAAMNPTTYVDMLDYAGMWLLTSPNTTLGTITSYKLVNINEALAFNFGGASSASTLYIAVKIVTLTTVAPYGSTGNDFELEIVTVW